MQQGAWLLLILSLPTKGATARMRLWRGLKALGAAALRDGAYLLPASESSQTALAEWAREAEADQGAAWLLTVQAPPEQEAALRAQFDRSEQYAELGVAMEAEQARLATPDLDAASLKKALRGLRRQFEQLGAIDYFPGPARQHAADRLAQLEQASRSRLFPEEPMAQAAAIARLDRGDYQGRTWATRRGLWVDRLASAWLIHRFIDTQARFLWLARIEDCPAQALGFDFDGAVFSHVGEHAGERVSFETLLASFGLEGDPVLLRLGAMVHALDVGGQGTQPAPEAAGFELMLRGLKTRVADDDQLLAEGGRLLDDLYAALAASTNET
jgi:hypothetical protein